MYQRPSTRRVLLTSLVVDFLDVVTNLLVAIATGSAVIFAELVQGVTDFLGSLFLVIGRGQARKPKDFTHPFGYARDVFFWSLVSSFIMLFIGATLSVYKGYHQVQTPEAVHYKEVALAILLFSTLSNGYALSQGIKKISFPGINLVQSFQESSQQLVKTAILRDLLGTLAALTGLLALIIYELSGSIVFDGVGAIAIGSLMAVFSLILINQSRHLLVGRTVSKKVINRIGRSVMKITEVININRLLAIYIGNDEILVDLDVELKDKLSTTKIEEILDQIKATIIRDVPETKSVQIDLHSARVEEKVKIEKK